MAIPASRRFTLGGLLLAALLGAAAPCFAQVTARQGPRDPSAFFDSMIIEGPLLPAMLAGTGPKEWGTIAEYQGLRKYQCDRIRMINFEFRAKKPPVNGVLHVEMRATFQSPDQNHDKKVDVTLEIHNGDSIIGTSKGSLKVPEGKTSSEGFEVDLPVKDLHSDPVTQLRITVQTRDI